MSIGMADDEPGNRDDDILDELRELREQLESEPELVSTKPGEAFELWMDQQGESAERTRAAYRYRIEPFLRFLAEERVVDLNDLTTRHVKEFESRRRGGDRERQTLNNQFGTLRQFLSYCADLDAVTEDVAGSVNVPELRKGDRVNTEKLVTERASTILEKLDRYRFASLDHVILLLFWRTTMRIGTLHGLDLEDFYVDEDGYDRLKTKLLDRGLLPDVVDEILDDVELPIVFPQHRPETGTPLKKKLAGERVINIKGWVADTVQEYIRVNRPDLRDEHGRRPLLATEKGGGRLSGSSIRRRVYLLTHPCEFGDPCPYGEDPDTCEAREHGHEAKCPGARSPHKIRTGSITWHRDRGWSVRDVAERAATSEELVRGVYDQPEQLIRGAVRRQHLDKLDEE